MATTPPSLSFSAHGQTYGRHNRGRSTQHVLSCLSSLSTRGVQESSIPTPSFCREIRGKELGLWPGASSDFGLHLSKAASNPVQGQESLRVESL